MTTSKVNTYWILLVIFLIAVIAVSSAAIWSKYRGRQPIEITIPDARELNGEIYIGGAVNNPGFYPLKSGDTLESLVLAAGGTTDNADLSQVSLYFPTPDESDTSQKIDINRAEPWLLMALPGIGEARAQDIVEYRRQNGPFRQINELVKVEGIGGATYERIKHLITVAD
ncbi:MAG: ComEA family DNA-binding protein [Chloroflexi bacterium]|nr:ComEA family DNA-binding protein [Chloroflexota bacterium]